MNKQLSKLLATLLVGAMLLGALQAIMSTGKAQPPAPAMWLQPDTETFNTNAASVGTLFNVTAWVNTTQTSSGWSAGLTFNSSQLQVVKCVFSGTAGLESQWLQDSGIATTNLFSQPATWDNVGGTIGSPAGFGETAYAPWVASSNLGSLFTIEFNITQAPPPGGSISSIIQWLPDISYPFDDFGIAESGFTYGNCTYTFSSSIKTQQQVTFAQTGLDNSASGPIVTINGTAKTYGQLPNSTSANSGDTILFSYQTTVPSSVSGKQFVNTGVNATSPLTVSANETVTGSYKTQYQVSFAVSPAGAGATTPSGTNVWEDAGSLSISATPNSGYMFSSWTTTGSITVTNPSSASTTATVSGSGTITANFVSGTTYSVTFTEGGLPSGTLWNVTFNGVSESSTSNTITFTGVSNGVYSYAVGNVLGYIALPASGSLTVNGANVSQAITFTGLRYYLTLVTNPPGIDTPTGEAWYGAGSSAPILVDENVTITPGSSRYHFNGWTTNNMEEIADASSPSTTVLMDENKTVTANYVTQCNVTFYQTGVSSDFTGTVVIVDGSNYTVSSLPASLWWDSGSTHSFAFQSPLVVSSSAKQYFWTSTTGLSTLQSASITITDCSVTGHYITGVHGVIVTDITAPVWVYQDVRVLRDCANISVTVKNIGDFPEDAWVTLYYNITANKIINAYPVHLGIGQNYTLTFVWNTADVPCHTYTLTAVATIPTGSNTLSDGTIMVRLLGDVNGDGRVDLRDIATAAQAFGSTLGNPKWNAAADVTGDGKMDMRDLAAIARQMGARTTY